MSKKTVAIIGSNGVLGADLVHTLKFAYNVIPINRENYSHMRGISCDVLINANGNSKRFWANEHVIEDFEASTYSVYKSILDFTFDRYIYISSSDVYEDHTSSKTTNEDQSINLQKLSAYGFHKHLSEIIVKKYARNYYILRSCLMLGKNLRKGPIYDLLNGKPLFIAKDSKLQMITTEAISALIDFFIKKEVPNTVLNIGGKGVVDFKNIEAFFAKGISVSVSEKAEKQVYEMNVSKFSKLYPLKSSEEYLKEYIQLL